MNFMNVYSVNYLIPEFYLENITPLTILLENFKISWRESIV